MKKIAFLYFTLGIGLVGLAVYGIVLIGLDPLYYRSPGHESAKVCTFAAIFLSYVFGLLFLDAGARRWKRASDKECAHDNSAMVR